MSTAGDIPKPPAGVRPPTEEEFGRSLAVDLRPLVDELRAMHSEFGLRPYRVFLVWGRWSGGARGEGQLQVRDREEILPTPLVEGMDGVSQFVRPVGLTEEGGARVKEISAAWTEDLLVGLRDGYVDESPPFQRTMQRDAEFWWEVRELRPRPAGLQPEPREGAARTRRFRVVGVPAISRDNFEWVVALEKQEYDPSREGDAAT